MTVNSKLSDVQILRLDGESAGYLPVEVQRAAEVLAAYVAGMDRGRQEAGTVASLPPTDPADLPGVPDLRDELTARDRAKQIEDLRVADAADEGNGEEIGACKPIMGRSGGGAARARTPATPEIVLVWGPDCYRQLTGDVT
jgi:hypothetical protein